METEQAKQTDLSVVYNTIMAFTEWLHGKRSYIIIVDGDSDEENLCIVEGDEEKLTNTIANGMLQHEPLKRMMMRASTAALVARMKQLGISTDLETPDV